eukprot:1195411-Prorocentrum_minimum.AAC.5
MIEVATLIFKTDAVTYTVESCTSAMAQTRGFHSPRYRYMYLGEEFIRGAMTKNPYVSTEVGPLMRDVKNHICRTLDMHGLIEDDHGMELLVAGKIVALDLPIARVHEQASFVYNKNSFAICLK